MVGGTPHYASPEVLSGRPAGEADDVWSLGVVLYEMVSGRHPFAGAGMDEVTDRILRQTHRCPAYSTGAAADPASAAARFAASILTSGRSIPPGDRPRARRGKLQRNFAGRTASRPPYVRPAVRFSASRALLQAWLKFAIPELTRPRACAVRERVWFA